VAALRAQPPETKLTTLAQKPEAIRADAPLSRAVVRMKEGRQLIVLDSETGTRVVGMLTITDLVRAHAGLVGGAGVPRVTALAARALDEVTASDIAEQAPIVSTTTNLKGLFGALARSQSNAVLVRDPQGQIGVVLLEHVRDFLDDEQLQPVLAATDLMRPAQVIDGQAPFSTLVTACLESEAAVVSAPDGAAHGELVTRASLGVFLLKWYARG
jgi:CBS domain-containing protein